MNSKNRISLTLLACHALACSISAPAPTTPLEKFIEISVNLPASEFEAGGKISYVISLQNTSSETILLCSPRGISAAIQGEQYFRPLKLYSNPLHANCHEVTHLAPGEQKKYTDTVSVWKDLPSGAAKLEFIAPVQVTMENEHAFHDSKIKEIKVYSKEFLLRSH